MIKSAQYYLDKNLKAHIHSQVKKGGENVMSQNYANIFWKTFKQSHDLEWKFKKVTVLISLIGQDGMIMIDENVNHYRPEELFMPYSDFYFEITNSIEKMCLNIKKFNILICTSEPGIIPKSKTDFNSESDTIKYCILLAIRKIVVSKLKVSWIEKIGMSIYKPFMK